MDQEQTNQLPLSDKARIEDLKIEMSDGNLPPWELEGAMVDLVVDEKKRVIYIVIPYSVIQDPNREDAFFQRLGLFCQKILTNLRASLPPHWRAE